MKNLTFRSNQDTYLCKSDRPVEETSRKRRKQKVILIQISKNDNEGSNKTSLVCECQKQDQIDETWEKAEETSSIFEDNYRTQGAKWNGYKNDDNLTSAVRNKSNGQQNNEYSLKCLLITN